MVSLPGVVVTGQVAMVLGKMANMGVKAGARLARVHLLEILGEGTI
jgi:hypothetical protein